MTLEITDKELEMIEELMDSKLEEMDIKDMIQTDSSLWDWVKEFGDLRTKIYLYRDKEQG